MSISPNNYIIPREVFSKLLDDYKTDKNVFVLSAISQIEKLFGKTASGAQKKEILINIAVKIDHNTDIHALGLMIDLVFLTARNAHIKSLLKKSHNVLTVCMKNFHDS